METGKVINRISNRLRRRSAALQETLGMSGAPVSYTHLPQI